MVSTYTPNINLEEPARGDQVGTWDTPVNNNMTLVDLVSGGIASITLNNSPVVLSAAQYQAKTLTFSSTLTGSVAITFPSTFKKSYEIQNLCTGSSAFVITLGTTVAGGQVICCPPGEITEVINDGSNLKFKSLARIGSFWDYAGSSNPQWNTACTVPPYLSCDGSTFSAVTYPQLAVILQGTTLPDTRGRARATLNQGTTRMSAGGVNGNTNFAAGGLDTETLTLAELPTNIQSGTAGLTAGSGVLLPIATVGPVSPVNVASGGAATAPQTAAGTWVGTNGLSITGNAVSNNTGGGAHTITQPTYIGGMTLIRAA